MFLEVLPGAGGLGGEAAESSHPVGNGERKAAADMGGVSAAGQNFTWLLI